MAKGINPVKGGRGSAGYFRSPSKGGWGGSRGETGRYKLNKSKGKYMKVHGA